MLHVAEGHFFMIRFYLCQFLFELVFLDTDTLVGSHGVFEHLLQRFGMLNRVGEIGFGFAQTAFELLLLFRACIHGFSNFCILNIRTRSLNIRTGIFQLILKDGRSCLQALVGGFRFAERCLQLLHLGADTFIRVVFIRKLLQCALVAFHQIADGALFLLQ